MDCISCFRQFIFDNYPINLSIYGIILRCLRFGKIKLSAKNDQLIEHLF